jgi:RNA polymerase sigma-70 factor (ECF subfamily)
MNEQDVLAERFEAHRARLRAVAYQALGSASEADARSPSPESPK